MQESTAAGKTEWVDPDDAPELTDDFFDDAEIGTATSSYGVVACSPVRARS